MSKCPKVCIIGAQDWGSAISTAVCKNVLNDQFDSRVHIYVYDELVRSNYLSDVMNRQHENIRYLPGIKLPNNLIAVNDLLKATQHADILIFATQCSFLKAYCNILAGNVKKTAYAVSLVKGLQHIQDGEIDLYSHTISKQLNIPCYSMMNATSAMEMAQGKLCEMTIGCNNDAHSTQLTSLFQTDNCMVFTVDDVDGVELCNTLKDLVALSAGFIDGLRLGENARVACLHLGLKEMMRFINNFNPSTNIATFLESCGLAHSVASSYADKNVTFAKTFVNSRKTIQEIEANLLNGRKLLGPIIAEEIYAYIQKEGLEKDYPLFSILHRICQREVMPYAIVDTLRNHPDLRNYSVTQQQKKEYLMSTPCSDILENLADTITEYSSNKFVPEQNDEREDMWRAYVNYFNDRNSSRESEELPRKSQIAMEAVDRPKIDGGRVEFLFEMEEGRKENETNAPIKAIGRLNSSTTQNGAQILSFDKSNDIIGTQFQNSNENFSNNIQLVKMSQKETDITYGKESADKLGLDNIYKGLTVTVRNKNQDSNKEKQSKTPDKKTEKLPSKSKKDNKAELKRKTEALKAKETDKSSKIEEDAKVQGRQTTDIETEQILYEKDSMSGMRLFDDEPNVFKLSELVEPNENKPEKKETDKKITDNHQSKNVSEQRKNNLNENNTKVTTDSKVIFKKKTTPEGYKYDYKICIQSKKVPLLYSKTDNSFPPTNSELETQQFWENYSFENLNKGSQLEMISGKVINQEEMPMSPVNPILAKQSNAENLHQQQLVNNEMTHLPYRDNVFNKHENKMINEPIAEDIQKSDSAKINKPGNQEAYNKHAFETSPILGALTNLFGRKETAKKDEPSNTLKGEKPISPKTIEPESKSLEGSKDSSKVQLNQRQSVENKEKEQNSRFISVNDKGYWESDSEKMLQSIELSPKLQVDAEDAIIDMKIPEVFENSITDSSKFQIDEDLKQNRQSIMSNFDKKQPSSGSLKKEHSDVGKIQKLIGSEEGNEPYNHEEHQVNQSDKENKEVERPKKYYKFFVDKSQNREQRFFNENRESDKRTDEKAEIGRKSHKEDRPFSAQTDSKYHKKGKKDGRPFDREANLVEMKDNNINRDSDEKTKGETEFKQKSRQEDRHLSAKPENKKSNKLYSEWDWLLDNDKFDDALDDIRLEKLKDKSDPGLLWPNNKQLDSKQGSISAENEPREGQQTTKVGPYQSGLKSEALNIEVAKKLASLTQFESETKSRQEESKKDEISSKRKRKPRAEKQAEVDRPEVKQRVKQILDNAKENLYTTKSNVNEKKTKKITKKLTKILTEKRKDHLKTKEQAVDYQGSNPYVGNLDIPSNLAFTNIEKRSNKKLRKVVVKPFHPPLNPRVRIPHPPFDVRDHEYHTFNFRPPTNRKAPQPQSKFTIKRHVGQAGARNVAKLPRPVLKLPASVMRSSVLAIELGFLATLLSSYRGGRK